MRANSLLLTLVALMGACVGYSPPVPVLGDRALLDGHWTCEYEKVMLGRSGSIDFVLGAGTDTAQGSVLMIPETGNQRIGGTRGPDPDAVLVSPQLLEIVMVRVDGQRVSGRLAAYRDPESAEMVTTIFSGYLEGDVIEGKFFTVDVTHEWAIEGRWRVVRAH